ncbi:unnamed protein product [Clonostachys chloroleuca]|uniref:Uncharacterized protein n=1 Tax=Clonostachys chloroleuca TaxID=1926264 RepID=A0AA35M594_9HYPO|nr:unnamed protein product [Clonostachys chloroleuca]
MSSSQPNQAQTEPRPKREMKVLCLGLPRTGSTSIAEALTILGYQNVHHCSKAAKDDWRVLNRAADATFACLPGYTGVPFTREEWDELYGPCEATTDAASMFGPQLIAAYPEAKVLLVERNYERWHRSVFGSLFPLVWNPVVNFSVGTLEPLIGSDAGKATRKMILGLFGARTPDEARRNARETYLSHPRRIRELVPPGQLLEYRLGDGWEPLCEFLGKEVPDVEFPWLNEADMLKRIAWDIVRQNFYQAAWKVLPWVVGLGAVGGGLWTLIQRNR